VSVTPADFRKHIQSLQRNGFTGVRFDQLIGAFEGRAALPLKPVVLTFDDAYANFQEHALEPLQEAGFSATVFAVAGLVGKMSTWPVQAHSIPRLPLLGWTELRELASLGFEIGSHTSTHARLDRLPAGRVEHEVVHSRYALEDGVGAAVSTFAYPFGLYDERSVSVVREHYHAACTTRMAAARRSNDRHLLPRFDVYYLRKPMLFGQLGKPLGHAYLGIRMLARALRGFVQS
jgi:peptidoglycan/xylan/chitin deacetylase (PgdA/CDA1 family)